MFSDPVVGENFFGRQDIVDLLIKRAEALKSGYRQNVAIIGHQQLGKTSILRQFLHVHHDPEVLAIYVEIKLQALDYFVDQFIRALLYQYLVQHGTVDPTDTLKNLSEKAAVNIPKTVSRIHEIDNLLKHRHAEEAYAKLFDLTHVLKEETGKHCIVILDEFHRLGQFGIKNAFSDFGKRIMVQKDTMYILSSSSFSQSRKILAEKLSLLFGNFERVYLEAFDFDTSFKFIEQKLSPLLISKSFCSFLTSTTDGHPFFLETLVSRLKEIALTRAEAEVSHSSVAETFLKLMYESQGVLNQYFSKLIGPWTQPTSRGSHVLILTEIAKGKNRLKEIASAINRSQKETASQLEELIENELIVKTGIFYRFHNRTFKGWLREVYEKKELSLLGTSGKSENYMNRVLEMINEHEAVLAMDIGERVMGLFRNFDNDIVEWGEKRRQLPYFSELVCLPSAMLVKDGSIRDIIAKGHGRCWVCKIVEEKATEKEVLALVHGVSDKKGANTKVLLALNGLDENAKLLAKEKHVLTLGLSRLNLLMDLYGKAPVIRFNSANRLIPEPPTIPSS